MSPSPNCCTKCCSVLLKVKHLFSDKIMIVINIIPILCILIVLAQRLAYARYGYPMFWNPEIVLSSDYQENTSAYFYILTVFITIFTVMLALAEFRLPSLRLFCRFMDYKVGRGLFMIFIALMLAQGYNATAIALTIIIIVVGCLNIFVGLG